MNRNVVEALVIVGMAGVMTGCQGLPDTVASPATPGLEQGRPSVTGAEFLMRNPDLKEWRDTLDSSTRVLIRDYGNTRRSGRVNPNVGLMYRRLPDIAARGFQGVNDLGWDDNPNWELEITIIERDGRIFRWIVQEEQIVAPSQSLSGQPYLLGGFAARETPEDGLLITANAEPQEPIETEWPQSQAA